MKSQIFIALLLVAINCQNLTGYSPLIVDPPVLNFQAGNNQYAYRNTEGWSWYSLTAPVVGTLSSPCSSPQNHFVNSSGTIFCAQNSTLFQLSGNFETVNNYSLSAPANGSQAWSIKNNQINTLTTDGSTFAQFNVFNTETANYTCNATVQFASLQGGSLGGFVPLANAIFFGWSNYSNGTLTRTYYTVPCGGSNATIWAQFNDTNNATEFDILLFANTVFVSVRSLNAETNTYAAFNSSNYTSIGSQINVANWWGAFYWQINSTSFAVRQLTNNEESSLTLFNVNAEGSVANVSSYQNLFTHASCIINNNTNSLNIFNQINNQLFGFATFTNIVIQTPGFGYSPIFLANGSAIAAGAANLSFWGPNTNPWTIPYRGDAYTDYVSQTSYIASFGQSENCELIVVNPSTNNITWVSGVQGCGSTPGSVFLGDVTVSNGSYQLAFESNLEVFLVNNNTRSEVGYNLPNNFGSQYAIFPNYTNSSANVLITTEFIVTSGPNTVSAVSMWPNSTQSVTTIVSCGVFTKLNAEWAIVTTCVGNTTSIQLFNAQTLTWFGAPLTVPLSNITQIAGIGVQFTSSGPNVEMYLAQQVLYNGSNPLSATTYEVLTNGTIIALPSLVNFPANSESFGFMFPLSGSQFMYQGYFGAQHAVLSMNYAISPILAPASSGFLLSALSVIACMLFFVL